MSNLSSSTRLGRRTALAAVGALAAASALGSGHANAATATATITSGSLTFLASPSTATFSATLNGSDQFVTAIQAFDVSDATGSGAGWNITATSTTFTSGADTLPTNAVTVQSAPSVACMTPGACTVATTNVSYPYTLPAAGSAPVATKLFNATANTGLGNMTVTATMRLAVPAATKAGTYSSTWTYSLVSGP